MPERVRVVVRVRPFLPVDPDDAELHTLVVDKTHVSVGDRRIFNVDRVFAMEESTADIFSEVMRPVVEDFLNGFNVCMMAYGQTGTGKTFTMDGLTRFVLNQIILDAMQGRTTDLQFQYVEVYGDAVRDLLAPPESGEAPERLQILDGGDGPQLVGVVRQSVQSLREALQLVQTAGQRRITEATSINEHSSRSHAIFTVIHRRDGAKLNIVDLAGSERANKTHNVGDRFQESIGINSGLLALGNVMRALSRNHLNPTAVPQHIPYRTHRLTRLLQDSLGGNSKTVFVACVAPDNYNKDESLRTLQYCALAMRVMNEPIKHYEELMQQQGRGRNSLLGAETEQELAELRYRLRSLQDQLHTKDQVANVQNGELSQAQERIKVLETELKKDELIFIRQIQEMQRLARDVAALQRRVNCATLPSPNVGLIQSARGGSGGLAPWPSIPFTSSLSSLGLQPLAPTSGRTFNANNNSISNNLAPPASGVHGDAETNRMLLTGDVAGIPQLNNTNPPNVRAFPFGNNNNNNITTMMDAYHQQQLGQPLPPQQQQQQQQHQQTQEQPRTPVIRVLHTSGPSDGLNPTFSQSPITPRPLAQRSTSSGTFPKDAAAQTSPLRSEQRRHDEDDDRMMELAQEALQYQRSNLELKNQLSSVLSMLEAQRRDSAMLRMELNEIYNIVHR